MKLGRHSIAKVETDIEKVSERNYSVGPLQVPGERGGMNWRDRQIKQTWCLSLIFYTTSTNE